MCKILSIILLFSAILKSQDTRYLDEIFDEVTKTEDVIYGNAPDLPFWFWVESNTEDIDLTMDIYEPEGDTLTNRPVIIFAHTGSFFSGHNELDDVVDLAISAAKRGYVAVSISYRLGLNILSTYSGERAVYRAVQDGGAAVRYLREFQEEFGINPDTIFMWGTSAGAILALHLSYLDDDDRPDATYGGGGDPDLGCPICEGNDYAHDPKPNALVSCWGAIGLLDWIDADDTVPSIMFHGTADPIVPINSGFPFTLDIALPIVYGSNLIHDRLDEVGIENELHAEPGLLHEYWGTVNGNWFGGPNGYFDQIQADAYSFLYSYLDCAQQGALSLCLVAEGGLSEVFLQWQPIASVESYNIYRNSELVGNTLENNFIDGQQGGWGLSFDSEYCYTITAVEPNGDEGISSDEVCATTLPAYQAFLQIDTSLANQEVAMIESPFGDLTGDGVTDALIMVKMVNFLPVNGYQFNFSMDPDIVSVISGVDGTNIQFSICISEAMDAGMTGAVATAYCEEIGYNNGLTTQMSTPGSSGTVIGFDMTGQGSIPAGYPGDGGDGGNLLALLVLDPEYSGPGAEVAVTISDFVISGINPFTGGNVALGACDADLDPFNGCFDISIFETPTADCAGIPGGSAVEDECGVCGGNGTPCSSDGDVNSDGVVNILDVITLVNVILEAGEFNSINDINGDGTVNILDIIQLVNLILNPLD